VLSTVPSSSLLSSCSVVYLLFLNFYLCSWLLGLPISIHYLKMSDSYLDWDEILRMGRGMIWMHQEIKRNAKIMTCSLKKIKVKNFD